MGLARAWPAPRADAEIRTRDPHFTRVVLYQLSYVGGSVVLASSERQPHPSVPLRDDDAWRASGGELVTMGIEGAEEALMDVPAVEQWLVVPAEVGLA